MAGDIADAPHGNFSGELAILPLRDTVLFPATEQTYQVGRIASIAALESLDPGLRTPVAVIAQLRSEVEHPAMSDLGSVGVLARVLSMSDGDGTTARVSVVALRGEIRIKLTALTQTTPHLRGRFESVEHVTAASPDAIAEVRALWSKLAHRAGAPPEISEHIAATADCSRIVGLVATHLAGITFAEQRELLEAVDADTQLNLLLSAMRKRSDETALKDVIKKKVKKGMQAAQREYYLREQLRAIQSELGGNKPQQSELSVISDKLAQLQLPEPVRSLVQRTQSQMQVQSESGAEYVVGLKLLQHVAALPWSEHQASTPDIAAVRAVLDGLHYGADEVADWVVEELAIRSLTERSGQALCLVGPPGVGKTTLAQAIARGLNRPLQTISLAGVYDPAFIRGHRRTYTGSEPGMLTTALQAAGMSAPVILLDEIDKSSRDSYRGSIGAALLQALDPTLNRHYLDEYLGVTIDLSQVLFIATANQAQDIYPPLRSRMRVLTFWGYSADEKLVIAQDYILSRMLQSHGLSGRVEVEPAAMEQLIERYTQEPGVRDLALLIERICRRCSALLATPGGPRSSVRITAASLDSFLGAPTVPPSMGVPKARIGRVSTIIIGDAGASVRAIDSIRFRGRGKLVITGSESDAVRERVQLAMSVVRHRAERFGFDAEDLYNSDMHVHIDSGLASNDVLNLDLALCLSLVSSLTGRAAPQRSAVIGSIDLHGDIRGCADFAARMAAAQRQRLDEVIVPVGHEGEIARLPHRILNGLTLRTVTSVDEAVEVLFGAGSRSTRAEDNK
jgi:ATP-dependent Lon protease